MGIRIVVGGINTFEFLLCEGERGRLVEYLGQVGRDLGSVPETVRMAGYLMKKASDAQTHPHNHIDTFCALTHNTLKHNTYCGVVSSIARGLTGSRGALVEKAVVYAHALLSDILLRVPQPPRALGF